MSAHPCAELVSVQKNFFSGQILLNDLEVRPAALSRFFFLWLRWLRWLRLLSAVRENHALPGLLGVNAENGGDRNPNVEWHPAEASPKADRMIGQLQIMGSGLAYVQYYLAVFDVLGGHADRFNCGVDDDMRRMPVVAHPFVHSTDKIRTF